MSGKMKEDKSNDEYGMTGGELQMTPRKIYSLFQARAKPANKIMRVLIATVTAGGGHLAAAAALEESWKKLRPNDVVKCVDVLEFASKLYRKIYTETYVKVVAHAPELYALVFKKTDNQEQVRKMSGFRRTFARRTNKGFLRHLKLFKPDVVLCTHYLPLEILCHPEDVAQISHPLTACVVTDFEAHTFWLEPSADFYCVATEDTKESLVARGAQRENIAVTGIPISSKFSVPIEPLNIRRRYGLRDDMPVLLVLGGGFGMGPVAEIVEQLDKTEGDFQMLVVAGRNEELRRELALKEYSHPARVIGFAGNMHELMGVADLIITKPGGLTTSEALALGKPILILNPIPGQEAANSDFLLERGAAGKVNRVDDLPFRLQQLLGSKKLDEMARAAKALGRPDAAKEICERVIERFEKQAANSKVTELTFVQRKNAQGIAGL
jgi:processive 1,2-diacylglycerol beta-glucosyltransferase